MTRTEIITRLCEMAAELADMKQKYNGDPDVKSGITYLEKEFQKTLNEIQQGKP